jgi:uncharacterized membrane protein YsdA (DUF1294 family)/cold shock CspA family protein
MTHAQREGGQPRKRMQFDGIIKTWNDDRGFGFIEPTQGGQEIFVHVKAFNGLRGRPQQGQRVTFQVELGPQGKKRALNVALANIPRATVKATSRNSPAQWGTASLFALPGFLIIVLAAHVLGHPPRWTIGLYGAASAITFLAYASDKAAAQKGAWRTSENTLHMLSLIGGWPGALLAQQWLRHKSSKAEFRATFWGTVVLNVTGFLFVASPLSKAVLHA